MTAFPRNETRANATPASGWGETRSGGAAPRRVAERGVDRGQPTTEGGDGHGLPDRYR